MSSIPGLISWKTTALHGDFMRLHAEDNRILFANIGYTIVRRYARDNFRAFFNQTKAGLDDPRRMGASCEDAQALTRMGKFGCQKAADRASSITHIFMKGYPFITIVTLAMYKRFPNRFGSPTSARRH
jgi:hypothetical protein